MEHLCAGRAGSVHSPEVSDCAKRIHLGDGLHGGCGASRDEGLPVGRQGVVVGQVKQGDPVLVVTVVTGSEFRYNMGQEVAAQSMRALVGNGQSLLKSQSSFTAAPTLAVDNQESSV